MAKENSEQREMVQEEDPLSAELDAELEALGEDEELNLTDALPTESDLSTKMDEMFEEESEEESPEQTEADEAAEILKETEAIEPEKKSAEDGKVDAITALRAANRAKDQAIEALQDTIAAAKVVEPVKKEPVEAPIERHARDAGYENSSDPDFSPSYNQMREQMVFEKQQETQTATEQAASDANKSFADSCTDAYKEMTAEKMGEGLDIGTIYDMGKDLLRKGDETNVYEVGTGQALYDECLAAIQRSGTKDQKELLALRLKTQNEKTPVSDKDTKKVVTAKIADPKPDEVTPTTERVGSGMSQALTDFVLG